jgi:hypothetical protein
MLGTLNRTAKGRLLQCAYCGGPSVSRDHVPPKNLFPSDQSNLITVPSCEAHNAGWSDLDERFRNYVAMRVGSNTRTTSGLWNKMVRGVRRNPKLQDQIRRNSVWHPDLNAFEIKIESDAFKPMIDRITRGLYWHTYKGDRLPLDIEIKIAEMRIGNWLPDFVSDMAHGLVGLDQFFYACKRMDDHPTISVWVYAIHRRLVAMEMTDVRLTDKLIAEFQSG